MKIIEGLSYFHSESISAYTMIILILFSKSITGWWIIEIK